MEQNNEIEIVQTDALNAIIRAEVDVAISTAKRFPRVLSKVKQDMLSFATLDEETAESCFYTLIRKNKDGGSKSIQGPSIRMAEIAAACYGNIKSGSRIILDDGKKVVAQGIAHDLERNVSMSIEVARRTVDKNGRPYGDDMKTMTMNAAGAIARRNAILSVVPLALVKPIVEAAKKVAVGDVKSLVSKRDKVVSRLKQLGITEDRIFAAVDAAKVDDIDVEKLEELIGLGTAIRDGQMSLEEAFPMLQPKATFEPKATKFTDTENKSEPEQKEQSAPATTTPTKAPAPAKKTETVPATLAEFIAAQKDVTEKDFLAWVKETGQIPDGVDFAVSSIPADIGAKIISNWAKIKPQVATFAKV